MKINDLQSQANGGHWWFALAGVLLMAAAGAGLYAWRSMKTAAPAAMPQTTRQAVQPVFVSAKIDACQTVDLAPPVEGTLEEVVVQAGEEVSEGMVLGRVRNSGVEVQLAEAEGEATAAQSKLDGLESVRIRAQLEATRAQAEATKARMVADATFRQYQRSKAMFDAGAMARLSWEKIASQWESEAADAKRLEELASAANDRAREAASAWDKAKQLQLEKADDLEAQRAVVKSAEIIAPVSGLLVSVGAASGDEVTRDRKDLFRIAVDLVNLCMTPELNKEAAAWLEQGSEAVVTMAETGDNGIIAAKKKNETGAWVLSFPAPAISVRPGVSATVRVTPPPR
jgi:HlyD family secretion protein